MGGVGWGGRTRIYIPETIHSKQNKLHWNQSEIECCNINQSVHLNHHLIIMIPGHLICWRFVAVADLTNLSMSKYIDLLIHLIFIDIYRSIKFKNLYCSSRAPRWRPPLATVRAVHEIFLAFCFLSTLRSSFSAYKVRSSRESHFGHWNVYRSDILR